MKKVYFHHDVLTVCYTIDSLTEQNIMDNTNVVMDIGLAVKHPEDAPNRKLGNKIAEGRLERQTFEIISTFINYNSFDVWLRNDNYKIYIEKSFNNKYFYIKGLECLK